MGSIVTRRSEEDTGGAPFRNVLKRYDGRCDWLDDDRFLHDLERDSVDTDLLDEELRSLEALEATTWRSRLSKCLDRSPVQVAMCLLVLLDAAVVIGEILLDLHAMKSQSREAYQDLDLAIDHIKVHFGPDYTNHSESDIIRILNNLKHANNTHAQDSTFIPPTHHSGSLDQTLAPNVRTKRRSADNLISTDISWTRSSVIENVQRRNGEVTASLLHRVVPRRSLMPVEAASGTKPQSDRPIGALDASVRKRPGGSVVGDKTSKDKQGSMAAQRHDDVIGQLATPYDETWQEKKSFDETLFRTRRSVGGGRGGGGGGKREGEGKAAEEFDGHYERYSEAHRLLKIAHILHYISIAILGVFVIQVFLKVLAMGKHFFKKKMEMFDAVIVLASFAMDLAFLEGVMGGQSEETVILMMVFLLWRILRIVNGMMVTTKQRQEFRIKLQRRARRRMDKRMDGLVEDIEWKEREILNLKGLSINKGASEEEIILCKPRRKVVAQKLTTSSGLSSIASLSLGLSLSGHLARGHVGPPPCARSPRPSLAGTKSTRSSQASLAVVDPTLLACMLEQRQNGSHFDLRRMTGSSDNYLDASTQGLPRRGSHQSPVTVVTRCDETAIGTSLPKQIGLSGLIHKSGLRNRSLSSTFVF